MALITKVVAGGITTLSDARYFAGMAVDWLGFDFDPASPDLLTTTQYQEMAGWVTGPKKWIRVGALSVSEILQLIEALVPDALEVPFDRLEEIAQATPLPIFVRFEAKNEDFSAPTLTGNVLAAIVPESFLDKANALKQPTANLEIWAEVSPESDVKALLNTQPIDGIFIKGSTEIKPGIKEYSFADLLEQLESND